MNPQELEQHLSQRLDPTLARDLVRDFVELQNDCKTSTLGRSSAGKFVETCVQVLQFLDRGSFDPKPSVDAYLKGLDSAASNLPDDLKHCLARVARGCYTIRNKRSIAHKGFVDPNEYDLRYLYAGAQWILSEITRHGIGTDMATAGKMIEFVQRPVDLITEDFGDRTLVFGRLTIPDEILIILHRFYPESVPLKYIQLSLERRSQSAISNAITGLWRAKFVQANTKTYKLTQTGFAKAVELLKKIGA